MSEIEVYPSKLKSSASRLESISKNINLYSSEVLTIRAALGFTNSTNVSIQNKLLNLSNELKSEKTAINNAADALESIATVYSSTEKDISKLTVNIEKISKAKNVTEVKIVTSYKSSGATESSETSNSVKAVLTSLSGINNNIGKYGKNEGVTLSSSVLSYLGTLYGITNSYSSSGIDITSDILSLIKSSAGVESAIYKYFEKTLHPYEALKLNAKFGKTMTGLSIASAIAGTASAGVETYKIFSDSNSTAYDKAAQSIKMGGSIFDLVGKTYIAQQASTKVLQFVNSTGGSSKAVNQILATEQNLQFTTSSAVAKKISKANTILAVGNVAASTISGGVKQYGKVTADGEFDMGDAGSVGVYASLSGLSTVTSSLTLGLVSFDSEKVAADIENDADEFVRGDSWAANVIRDQEVWAPARFAVAVGSGGYLIGKKVVNGVASGAKTVGSWISTGWNTVTNLF